jgi:hypothetical protein
MYKITPLMGSKPKFSSSLQIAKEQQQLETEAARF